MEHSSRIFRFLRRFAPEEVFENRAIPTGRGSERGQVIIMLLHFSFFFFQLAVNFNFAKNGEANLRVRIENLDFAVFTPDQIVL